MIKKICGLLVVLMTIVGCSFTVQNAEDIYVAEVNKYLDSFDSIIKNGVKYDYSSEKALSKSLNDNLATVRELRKGVEKIKPAAKFEKEHKNIVDGFKELEKFSEYMLEASVAPDPNVRLKFEQSADRLVDYYDAFGKLSFRRRG